MAYHLFGTKPLPELMLTYSQLDPYKQTSSKRILEMSSAKLPVILSALNVIASIRHMFLI